MVPIRCLLPVLLLGCLSCNGRAQSPAETGPQPTLPAPQERWIPTVNVAPAVGWPEGTAPTAAPGLDVTAFARGLDHPRWLYVLPNGDVLVAETHAPPKPAQKKGLRTWFMQRAMKKAGAATPSANRINLLRDADSDGVAELRTVFLTGLFSPFGMALVDGRLYIANADAIVSVPYREGQTASDAAPVKLVDLPGGPLNHHWTKSLLASVDGRHLYVGVGSNSNVGENGMAMENDRAAILQVDVATGARRVFASGLRNPVGLAWEPQGGALWTVVNERDELGDALVPDYLTSVREGAFYGWPYSYYGGHVDARVQPPRPDLVARAIAPDYALGAHVAALGLAFHDGAGWPAALQGGAFIGEHGSWNRREPAGYRLVFVRFANGRPQGAPVDVLTGFLDANGNARGRPVGVAVDARDGVLLADDVGNVVWRVAPAARP
ncbi:sorbosone dehydrogenase family protein [Pseudoxanthomonas sp. PXM03]|uniref:PQQ-dependent sugar dehydrogenase n=1 Tax=Pseudoxanthomonas sp. PXM03 TaxID=2769284 RepID=UPI0017850DFB|nr:sorbosone dehydrogenase family protein [Pseudoxanthomonas sp. PXM03]